MSERSLRDVREMLCREMDDIATQKNLSQNAVDYIQKLTSSIKNIDKIIMYDRYKEAGSYDNGYSSRRYTSYGDRYMNDGRSWGDAKETMMQQLSDMMSRAGSDRERDVIRKARDEIRAM